MNRIKIESLKETIKRKRFGYIMMMEEMRIHRRAIERIEKGRMERKFMKKMESSQFNRVYMPRE